MTTVHHSRRTSRQHHDSIVTSAPSLSDEEMRAEMHAFAKEDEEEDKTWTRRFVESYLSKFQWYYPMKDSKDGPSLSDAYAFYEHVTLPRHFLGTDDRAEPGEANQPTLLYDPFRTDAKSFVEWGIGMDMYFSTLKMVSGMMLIAGLLNIHNILYYASSDYSPNGQDNISSIFLKGSALCTTSEWVVCRDCVVDDYELEARSRIGVAQDGSVLVQHNDCNGADMVQGTVNFATFFFLLGSMAFMSIYLGIREVRSDEDKCTATDYSVVVQNPPPKAFDPDQWKDFFEKQFGSVTCVTIALDNDEMLRKLTERRMEQHKLRLLLSDKVHMDDTEQVLKAINDITLKEEMESSSFSKNILNPLLVAMGMIVPPRSIFNTIERLTEEIRQLQDKEFSARNVFVTFETEEAQRKCLTAMSIGRLDIWMNRIQRNDSEIVFQDRLLVVEEPVEPDSVRWLDLSSNLLDRYIKQFNSLLVTILSLVISGVVVGFVRSRYGPYTAGMIVSVFNSIIPIVVSMLMTNERHLTEGSFQTSLYIKITLFRFVNTAILASMTTPLTGTLVDDEEDILPSIKAILVSELYVTPLLSLIDISSNMNKHLYAPRAKTQEQMNTYFQGTEYSIGERYTGLTSILFVCFFYSALFPAAFFFGAAILFVQHYTDKFCLMRIWARQPMVGSKLARFSRRYFFYGSLVASLMVSAYAWAQYPYDNLCEPANDPSYGHARDYFNVKLFNGTQMDSITVTQDHDVQFCSQRWLDADVFPFPPTSRLEREDLKYMSESQRTLVDYYGWTAFAVLVGYVIFAFGTNILHFVSSFFRGIYEPSGMVQHIDFSSNEEIYGYVPQIKLVGFAFPLLACDVDEIPQELIGWTDSRNSYDFHNMIFDVPYDEMKRTRRGSVLVRGESELPASEETGLLHQSKPIFSIVKHYPPSWMQKKVEPSTEDPDTGAPAASTAETILPDATTADVATKESRQRFGFLGGFLSNKTKTT